MRVVAQCASMTCSSVYWTAAVCASAMAVRKRSPATAHTAETLLSALKVEVEPRRAFPAPRVLGELLPIGREASTQAVERIRADRCAVLEA